MMIRRALIRPAKLDYSRPDRAPGDPQFDRRVYGIGDWVFVGTLLVIALTGFLLEGVRIAMADPGYGATQFGGWIVAQALTGLSDSMLAGLRHGIWWFHGLLAITFVASIPFTKAAHMLSSFVSLSLRDPLAGKRLRSIPPERAAEPAGYGDARRLQPAAPAPARRLYEVRAVPRGVPGQRHRASAVAARRDPRAARAVAPGRRPAGIGGLLGALVDGKARRRGGSPRAWSASDGVRTETVWACMQCNACVEICPVGIEQAPIINQLRRRLVEEGELDPNLQSTLEVIHKSGNSFGENRRRRGRWTEGARLRGPRRA